MFNKFKLINEVYKTLKNLFLKQRNRFQFTLILPDK